MLRALPGSPPVTFRWHAVGIFLAKRPFNVRCGVPCKVHLRLHLDMDKPAHRPEACASHLLTFAPLTARNCGIAHAGL